ncbi:hypothetical protein [uncultured Hoeflea sp.]|uniref:hypothetical protein n=1 Tax=uncultured Hoeflea sp. TaxID=538666 RepID=UPI0030DCD987|tara:strand:- start:484 stop:705 length:222 start_codon:yes stop_codon:yes gene_type:complete
MKTLISAVLLTVLAGTSAAFAIPPIPRSIDIGYTEKAPVDTQMNYRLGNNQAEIRKVSTDSSLELLTRTQLEH